MRPADDTIRAAIVPFPASAAHRYRADIDGLRAVAIVAVVLFHAELAGFAGGYVGVDIFFVISGYLIGGIVFREVRAGRFSFAAFYVRRAKRILPALLCLTSCATIAAVILLPPSGVRDFVKGDAAALLGVANVRFWALAHYLNADWQREPLVMTWSLGVEEQFYLFLPPTLLLLHRYVPRMIMPAIAIGSLVSLLVSMHLVKSQPNAAFYLLPGRAWELGVGVMLALRVEDRAITLAPRLATALSLAGCGAIALAIATFDDHTPFPGLAALLPVLGTAALIATSGSWINRRLLSAEPVRFVGLISYSWYLWHMPPIVFARLALGREPVAAELAMLVALSFAAATLSWRFVEQPFRKRSAVANPQILKRYGAALLAGLGLAGAAYLSAA